MAYFLVGTYNTNKKDTKFNSILLYKSHTDELSNQSLSTNVDTAIHWLSLTITMFSRQWEWSNTKSTLYNFPKYIYNSKRSLKSLASYVTFIQATPTQSHAKYSKLRL